ncbi:calmodulin-like 3 [Kappamyces sp. JEL0829]|nr:calmodulin-like 3 [Kappamyces sp. JEL0829]
MEIKNAYEFNTFETRPETSVHKEDVFDLKEFLAGLKTTRPKRFPNTKSNRVSELKASLDKSPYEGLSKEECLYYIEVWRRWLIQAFCAFDIDGSGAINEVELLDAMLSLNMNFEESQVKDMIKTVDVDGDGDVSIDEFIKLMVRIRAKSTFLRTQEQIDEAFQLTDQDEDGYIGCMDLYNLYQDIGENVSMEECKNIILSICGDIFYKDDVRVSLQQFTLLAKTEGN